MPQPALSPGRPCLHFTPPGGWLNDPNGLVYLDGEYHLFYQHHPASLDWGPMHWGHAVSRDLARWEHLPIALAPDELGAIFSGSAVIDRANSAGFGAGAMVAIFTHDIAGRQAQSLAFSGDRGRSWTKYAGNPVLAPADAPADFRDPRVLWYDSPAGGHWAMLLAAGQEIWLYTSPDLKVWTKASVFGAGHGAHGGVWECPELLSLPVDGGPERRWALAVGVQQGAPGGGSGTQYFVGDFDGATFTSDDPPGSVRWADYGADFYAAQAWQNAPGERALWLAWMSNWDYARETPATGYRGMMTAPRELGLAREPGGLRLVQRLAPELVAGWPAPRTCHDLSLGADALPLEGLRGETALIEATFRAQGATAARFGLRLGDGAGAGIAVGYDLARGAVFVERPQLGQGGAGEVAAQLVPLSPRDGLVRLQLLVDGPAVELFAAEGSVCLSNQLFAPAAGAGLELFAEGGQVALARLEVREPGL